MLKVRNIDVDFVLWNKEDASSKWGMMSFKAKGVCLEPRETEVLRVYQVGGESILDVSCFILNNISEEVLMESSLESICDSVLSVVRGEDIVVSNGANIVSSSYEVSSDFLVDPDYGDFDEELDEELFYEDDEDDEYIDDSLSETIDGVDYYDDMDFDFVDYDDDEDED